MDFAYKSTKIAAKMISITINVFCEILLSQSVILHSIHPSTSTDNLIHFSTSEIKNEKILRQNFLLMQCEASSYNIFYSFFALASCHKQGAFFAKGKEFPKFYSKLHFLPWEITWVSF